MADAVRDVVIRLNLETGRSDIQAPDTSAITDALEEEVKLRKDVEIVSKAAFDAQKAYEAELAAATDAANAALEEQANKLKDAKLATDQLRQATKEMIGVTRKVGDGLLSMGRAAALLGGSNEDLQAMLKNLILIQGAMDLWKGGADILEGIIDGLRTAAVMTEALALAEASEAGSASASAVAAEAKAVALRQVALAEAGATAGAIGHTGAMIAEAGIMATVTTAAITMWAALWPIAIIMAAIAAAAWLAYEAYQWFTKGSRDAEEAEKAHTEQLVKLEEQHERVAQSKIRLIGIHADEAKELRGLNTVKEQLAELEASNLEAQLAAVNAEQDNLGGNARARDLDLIAAKREVIMAQIEEQAALEQKGHDTAKKDLELREAELKVTREQIKAAKESLQAERDKTDSLAEQFGAMSVLDQQRLKQLEEIKNTTGLTLEQAKEMKAINAELAGPEAEAVIRQAGEEAGIGGFNVVKKARADQGAAAAKIAESEEGAAEEETSIAKAKIDATKSIKEFVDNLTDLMEDGIKQVATLKEMQERQALRQAGRV